MNETTTKYEDSLAGSYCVDCENEYALENEEQCFECWWGSGSWVDLPTEATE